MADEVTSGELGRRLDVIQSLLHGLVSREEYSSDQRHFEHRFTELERDLEAERARRHTEFKELRNEIMTATRERGSSVRQGIYSGLVPSLLVLLSIMVSVALTLWGSNG